VAKRRSLTPSPGLSAPGVHATRRGGARRELTDRVHLAFGGSNVEGWTLNVSRGGIRLILEDAVELGVDVEIQFDALPDAPRRKGRVVWVQEELDGVVVGVKFLDVAGEAGPTDDFN
jgi:hypothetical protein